MEIQIWQILIVVGLFGAGLVAYFVHHRRQLQRVHGAETAVNAFLLARYAKLPMGIRINCSHDWNWPVLVFFVHPVTGIMQRLQFSFATAPASLKLIADDPIV